jgi:hypothetical protein
MTATLTPAVQDLFSRFAQLSPQEQQVVREKIIIPEADIPESHWEILMERERLHEQGLDPAIPANEAFRQIRETLRSERAGAL